MEATPGAERASLSLGGSEERIRVPAIHQVDHPFDRISVQRFAVVASGTLGISPCTNEGNRVASSGKRKTTMAKLNRERKLLERRQEKQARKVARKLAAADARADTTG